MRLISLLSAFVLVLLPSIALGASDAVLSGKITDAAGQPLPGATVIIYYAAVKSGYSSFCPSCYADCGKRATTDAQGGFTLRDLNSDLTFQLLVVKERYSPSFIKHVDPAKGPAVASIAERHLPEDRSRIVSGRVVDPTGKPVPDAIIVPKAVHLEGGVDGDFDGLDPLAVSNANGEFELTYTKPATDMSLLISARALAPKHYLNVTTGAQMHILPLSEGASVKGRLLRDGMPVPNAEIGLVSQDRGADDFFTEVRIGTQPDGSFLLSNLPVPGNYYVYAKMDSILKLGASDIVKLSTVADGKVIVAGDLTIHPGHHLRGRVVLTDGKPIPENMRIIIGGSRAWDVQETTLAADGSFGFINIPTDNYSINPAVAGYHLSPKNPNLSWSFEGFIDGDIDSFIILLDAGPDDFNARNLSLMRGRPFQSAPYTAPATAK